MGVLLKARNSKAQGASPGNVDNKYIESCKDGTVILFRPFSIKPTYGAPNRKGTAGYKMRPKDALEKGEFVLNSWSLASTRNIGGAKC